MTRAKKTFVGIAVVYAVYSAVYVATVLLYDWKRRRDHDRRWPDRLDDEWEQVSALLSPG